MDIENLKVKRNIIKKITIFSKYIMLKIILVYTNIIMIIF